MSTKTIYDLCRSLTTGYIRKQTLQLNIDIPFDIIGLCLLFYHIKITGFAKEYQHLLPLCYSNNISKKLEAIKQFRILLSRANQPPIREVINMGLGIMPCFMKFCNNDQNPELQNESLWAMANITSGPSECIKKHVINNDGINILINIFQSPLYEIKEHVLWSLGNIAADSLELKDLLFTNNILSNILQIYAHKYDKKYVTNFSNSPTITKHPMQQYINLLTTGSWVLSNLCRQSAPPNIKYLNDLIKCLKVALEQALNMNDNINTKQNGMIGKKNEIIINIAWGFSYLTGFDKYEAYLMNKMDELNITKQVVEL
eukprot:196361_1